jgi:ubiquinol-cytochrome c reductase cytochrome b subunit
MSLWGGNFAQNDIIIYSFILHKISSSKRIGPHNKDILQFLYGSLLGDGHLERHGNGSRFSLQQEDSHKDYLLWSHHFLASRNYTNPTSPEIKSRIGNKNKIRYTLSCKTWTFTSFNIIHQEWYLNNIKILPSAIDFYLNPLALAVWIMNDGSRSGDGLKLSTNNFSFLECERLANILRNNFNLKVSIHKTGT